MPDRIDGFLRPASSTVSRSEDQSRAPRGEPAAVTPPASAPTDLVSLTESARRLSELSREAAAGEAVDMGRVETIRQALDDGVYQIDPRKIAENLLRLEQAIGD